MHLTEACTQLRAFKIRGIIKTKMCLMCARNAMQPTQDTTLKIVVTTSKKKKRKSKPSTDEKNQTKH